MMQRWWGIGLILSGLITSPGFTQLVVPIEREPRHRLVWEEGPVRILDIRIPPGDTTLFHIHDAAILYVAVALSPVSSQIQGQAWTEPGSRHRLDATQWDTLYAVQPVTHRVANAGPTLFHLIAVLNRGQPAGNPSRAEAPLPGTVQRSGSWFRQTRVVLAPGDATEWFRSSRPIVVVQQGAGQAVVDRAVTEFPGRLSGSGTWVYLAPDAQFRLHSDSNQPTALVLIEVR